MRFAARLLFRKSPMFACSVIALLLRPLPVRDPESLQRFVTVHPPLALRGYYPFAEYDAWQKQASGFSDVLAWSEQQASITDGRLAERARVDFVSGNFFTVLGVKPALGRLFSGENLSEGSAPAILNYAYWQRRFGGDANVI